MAGQLYMIVDSINTTRVIQPGQPQTQIAAWLLDIPDGQTAEQTAEKFVIDQRFPIGSAIYLVDAAQVTPYTIGAALTAA